MFAGALGRDAIDFLDLRLVRPGKRREHRARNESTKGSGAEEVRGGVQKLPKTMFRHDSVLRWADCARGKVAIDD